MPEYTIASIIAVALICGLERYHWRTGLFRLKAFWISYAIVLFFQVLVDGWLTKLPHPVVAYDERFSTGWRFPFDIPVEDYLFGFALVSLGLILWLRSEK